MNDLEVLNSDQHFETLKREKDIFLAYFSTPECRVCQTLKPMVKALIDELEVSGIYVNTHEHPVIAGQHLIFAVPTIALFVDGRESARFSRHFGMAELRSKIERMVQLIREDSSIFSERATE